MMSGKYLFNDEMTFFSFFKQSNIFFAYCHVHIVNGSFGWELLHIYSIMSSSFSSRSRHLTHVFFSEFAVNYAGISPWSINRWNYCFKGFFRRAKTILGPFCLCICVLHEVACPPIESGRNLTKKFNEKNLSRNWKKGGKFQKTV